MGQKYSQIIINNPTFVNCDEKFFLTKEGTVKIGSAPYRIESPYFSCYEGTLNENLEAEGKGNCLFNCGCSYRGEWKNGFPDGFGVKRISNRCLPIGLNYKGIGRLSYRGKFTKGAYNGKYKLIADRINLDSVTYWEGNCTDGIFSGLITAHIRNMDCNISDIVYDIKGSIENFDFTDNNCSILYKNGSIYIGNIVKSKIIGNGLLTFTGGSLDLIAKEKQTIRTIKCEGMLHLSNIDYKFIGTVTHMSDSLSLKGTFESNEKNMKTTIVITKDGHHYDGHYEATYNIPEEKIDIYTIKYEDGTYVNKEKVGVFLVKLYKTNKLFSFNYRNNIVFEVKTLYEEEIEGSK